MDVEYAMMAMKLITTTRDYDLTASIKRTDILFENHE